MQVSSFAAGAGPGDQDSRWYTYECAIPRGSSHNVRSAPDTASRVVGSLQRDQTVVVKKSLEKINVDRQAMKSSKSTRQVWVEIYFGVGEMEWMDTRLLGWTLLESRPTGVLACVSRNKVYLRETIP